MELHTHTHTHTQHFIKSHLGNSVRVVPACVRVPQANAAFVFSFSFHFLQTLLFPDWPSSTSESICSSIFSADFISKRPPLAPKPEGNSFVHHNKSLRKKKKVESLFRALVSALFTSVWRIRNRKGFKVWRRTIIIKLSRIEAEIMRLHLFVHIYPQAPAADMM